MSSSHDRYMKRLMGTADAIRIHRKQQYDFNNNYSFRIGDSFRDAKIITREQYDMNNEEWQDLEIQLKNTQKKDEKKIYCRPGTELSIGSYVKYGKHILILSAEIQDEEDPMSCYVGNKCLRTLHLEGCPYVFPLYSSNSSYSAKGVRDTGTVELMDERNKAYVQRNKFTVRFFQHHKNYRIALGDEEVQTYYIVTNCDDSSTPGMFTLTLKIDEKHPNDKGLFAYNENPIDFSDLIPTENEQEEVEWVVSPELSCDTYQKLNNEFEVICNKPISNYDLPLGIEFVELSEDGYTLKLNSTEKGIKTITITDSDNKIATKKIVVKE